MKSNAGFFSVGSPTKADASGLVQCLSDSLLPLGVLDTCILDLESLLGVEGKPILVGGGTDGAK